MDPAELEMFERSLRGCAERHSGEALDADLAELGWADALAEDHRSAIAALFTVQGEANATSSALDSVMAWALTADPTSAFVLPRPGTITPPGQLAGSRVRLDGLATAGLARAQRVLAVVDSQAGGRVLVTLGPVDLAATPVGGIDPDLGLLAVTATDVAVEEAPAPADGWGTAVALGQIALAHQLVGGARTMLELARQHALERVQFGRPIGSFQAIRHRLAETLVAVEAAREMLEAVWDEPAPALAPTAKALAGRSARIAARHCQQVLAGIGFTAEHPFHRYLRRSLALDQLLGSTQGLIEQLGADLVGGGRLPATLPL